MKIELTKEEIKKAIIEYVHNTLNKKVNEQNIIMKYSLLHDDLKDYSFICEINE